MKHLVSLVDGTWLTPTTISGGLSPGTVSIQFVRSVLGSPQTDIDGTAKFERGGYVITIGYFTKDDNKDLRKRKGIVYAILVRIDDDDDSNTHRSPIIFDGAWNHEGNSGWPKKIKANSALGTTSLRNFIASVEYDCRELGYVHDGETPTENKKTREEASLQAQKSPKPPTAKPSTKKPPTDFVVDAVPDFSDSDTVRPYCEFQSGFLFLDDQKPHADLAFGLYGLRELKKKNPGAAPALDAEIQKYENLDPPELDGFLGNELSKRPVIGFEVIGFDNELPFE